MVTSPSPGFIAHPIPANVGPFPMTRGIRPPPGSHPRMPATAIGTDFHPGAVGRKWLIKVCCALDFDPRGESHCGRPAHDTATQDCSRHQERNQTCFHKRPFVHIKYRSKSNASQTVETLLSGNALKESNLAQVPECARPRAQQALWSLDLGGWRFLR